MSAPVLNQLKSLLDEPIAEHPLLFADSQLGLVLIQLAAGRDPGLEGWSPPSHAAQRAQEVIARRMLIPTASHYSVLGLSPAASAQEIKENYRRLIALVHPDSRPSGFPADAAIQVNLAYSILSEPEQRERYDASLRIASVDSGNASLNRAPSRNTPTTAVSRHDKGWSAILGAVSSAFTARKALIWMAAVLSLPLIYFLVAGRQTPEPTRLIEARPALKLEVTPPPVGPSESRLASSAHAGTSVAVSPPHADAIPPLKSSATLSERLLRVDSAPRKEPSPDHLLAMGVNAHGGIQLASPKGGSDPSLADKPQIMARIRPVAADIHQAEPPRQRGHAKDELVGESLAQLVEAFEAGSSERLSRVLASGLVGRERILSDFEQIFRATRRRELRLLRIDQQAQTGPTAKFSGVAEMAMITLDGNQNQQRIFISGVSSLQQGRAVIAQWSSYPVQ